MQRIALALVPMVLFWGYFRFFIFDEQRMQRQGIVVSPASMADTSYRNSMLTNFCYMAKSFFTEPPQDYSQETVVSFSVPQQAVIEGRRCDVVVVLMESYFTLDNFDTAQCNTDLTANFDRLKQEGISGYMLSDQYGGGTSNIEFSVLTGFSNALLPVGSVPFMEYIGENYPCYPNFLKKNGYQTMALHSYNGSMYDRSIVYPSLGIDSFLTEEVFTAEDYRGTYIGDRPTLAKTLELLDAPRQQDSPMFLHVVTMQNHIPNSPGVYPADYCVDISIEGENEHYNGCLTTIATSLRDADEAIGWFTDQLRQRDRDTVVLFFGDHQTNINGDQGEDLITHMDSYQAMTQDQQRWATHVTPYLMWANFPLEGGARDGGLLPTYQLLPTLLHEFDVLRPAWMEWLYTTQDSMRGYLLGFVLQPDGTSWATELNEDQKETLRQQELLQYDLMFGQEYMRDKLYGDA